MFICVLLFFGIILNIEYCREYTHLPLYSVDRVVYRQEDLAEQSGYQAQAQPDCE